jgi:hypothetical protein
MMNQQNGSRFQTDLSGHEGWLSNLLKQNIEDHSKNTFWGK